MVLTFFFFLPNWHFIFGNTTFFLPSFFSSSIFFPCFLLPCPPQVFSPSSCVFSDLQPLRNCSCTGAVSDPGTDFEEFEEDASWEVGEVWEEVPLLIQKVHRVMSQAVWPNPNKISPFWEGQGCNLELSSKTKLMWIKMQFIWVSVCVLIEM